MDSIIPLSSASMTPPSLIIFSFLSITSRIPKNACHIDDQRSQIDAVCDRLKQDEELLSLIRGTIAQHDRRKATRGMLRRGVWCLEKVPDYVVRDTLVELTQRDLSFFTNMSSDDCRYPFLRSSRGPRQVQAPEVEHASEGILRVGGAKARRRRLPFERLDHP